MEYAIEAINNAGTCVGILCSDGIVLAAERKTTSKLLAPSKSSDKIYQIDGHIACVVAGLTSDANILINQGEGFAREGKKRRRLIGGWEGGFFVACCFVPFLPMLEIDP